MTAERIIREKKPVLKLKIHEYEELDLPFLDELGINKSDDNTDMCRYRHIHSQESFREIKSAILERYKILEEKGPRVFLERKE